MPSELKKANSPTFNRGLKKLKDTKSWFPRMKNSFELHNYTEHMEAMITIFSLKGKKNVIDLT